MSCGCLNRKFSAEYERIQRLAKGLAVIERKTVKIYRKEDGTYGFCLSDEGTEFEIIEYISPY